MSSFHVFDRTVKYPLSKIGLTGEQWGINVDTLVSTWGAMLLLVILTIFIRVAVQQYNSDIVSYCARSVCKVIRESVREALGIFDQDVFGFVFGLFLFTLSCNYIGIIPIFGEPTIDINTALALGFSSFSYVQYQGIKAKGFRYFYKYFSPVFILFPLNVIQQLAKIASLSFRLFGNMLGDTIIWSLLIGVLQYVWFVYIPLTVAALLFLFFYNKLHWSSRNGFTGRMAKYSFYVISFLAALQCFFGLFQGFIQAYVIALLTNMYVATERSNGDGH